MSMTRYEELEATYKIRHNTHCLITMEEKVMLCPNARHRTEMMAMEPYDIVVEPCGYGFDSHKFRVLKNKPSLSQEDLAIICGRGDLRAGFTSDGTIISLYNREVKHA